MFGIFGLIISLVKIFIYSTVYSILTLTAFYILSKTTKIVWIKKLMNFKFATFIVLGAFYGISFLIYSFSYWQDSGFGDSFKIPIGNGFQVSNIDGTSTYFEDEKIAYSRQASLTNFTVSDKKLCASFQGFNSNDCNDCYIVFDTKKSKMYEFHSTNEYENFAKANNLPFPDDFKPFMDNYKEYWDSHSKWYLP